MTRAPYRKGVRHQYQYIIHDPLSLHCALVADFGLGVCGGSLFIAQGGGEEH